MRVLVTGAGGFVGGAIARSLSANGYDVTGLLHREVGGKAWSFPTIVAELGRVDAVEQILSQCQSCEAVVHAAARISKEPFDADVGRTNCVGTQQLLDVAARWRATNFVYISSIAVIGRPIELPVTEMSATACESVYAASKLFGEHIVRVAEPAAASRISLRITAPVGAEMPANRILSVFVKRALTGEPLNILGKGTREQNYVDVRDIASAVEACLQHRETGIFNIGGLASITNVELARRCIHLLNSRSEISFSSSADPEEGLAWRLSLQHAASRLGWAPQHDIASSIAAVASSDADRTHQ